MTPPPVAPPLPGPVLLTQGWHDVAFLHWALPPEAVEHLLPTGTRPDVLNGVTYAGIVAFGVTGTRLLGTVPVGSFTEVNVRLYSVDDDGRRGVVFLSMDADSAHNVAAARLLAGLPYAWSDASVRRAADGTVGYACRRRRPRDRVSGGVWVRPGARKSEQTDPDVFVTARWGLHTRHLGATHWVRIAHRPWELHHATLVAARGCSALLTAAGLPDPREPPSSVLWAPGAVASVAYGGRVRTAG
ncbi:DUF2071 domain-containing protein [Marinactinospora endophytica]